MSTHRASLVIALALLGCGETEHAPRASSPDSTVDAPASDAGADVREAGEDASSDSASDADTLDVLDGAGGDAAEDGTSDATDSETTACASALSTTKTTGSCESTVQNWTDEGNAHVEPGTAVSYCTTPPNSGTHYSIWAAYRTYDKPVPYGYLVHNMEHGAVVLRYRCAAASLPCADKQKALEAVAAMAVPSDPICTAPVSRRVVIAPDPTLPFEVGASAWTWTYTANCVDAPSLSAFITAHYGKATEDVCADGVVPP